MTSSSTELTDYITGRQAESNTPISGNQPASDWRARAEGFLGTPYKWGGTTKEGIDCSAFVSNVWGLSRQTTDTLPNVSVPISRQQLQPGDALNLPTWKDPRGYGHVRLFAGWANPEKTKMLVYESASNTGGAVRRVIDYDPSYQPLRLKGREPDPEGRAEQVAEVSEAAGATQPSRPYPINTGKATPAEAKNISVIGQLALKAGLGQEGARAAQAIATFEGGLSGRSGDNNMAHGWFQMHEGGELANYARAHGWSIQQARAVVASQPEHAAEWALNNYLGNAIKDGMSKNLSGEALAVHAQTVGQRSKTPEKVAGIYRSMFSATTGQPVAQKQSNRDDWAQSSEFSPGASSSELASYANTRRSDPNNQSVFANGPTIRQITPEERQAMQDDVQSQVRNMFAPPEQVEEAMRLDSMTKMMQGLPSPIWKKNSKKGNLPKTGFEMDPYSQDLDPTAGLYDTSPTRRRSYEYQPLLG